MAVTQRRRPPRLADLPHDQRQRPGGVRRQAPQRRTTTVDRSDISGSTRGDGVEDDGVADIGWHADAAPSVAPAPVTNSSGS